MWSKKYLSYQGNRRLMRALLVNLQTSTAPDSKKSAPTKTTPHTQKPESLKHKQPFLLQVTPETHFKKQRKLLIQEP